MNNINKPVGYKILIYTTIQVLKYFIKAVAYYNSQDKTTIIRTLYYSIVTNDDKPIKIFYVPRRFGHGSFFFPLVNWSGG